MSIKDRRTNIKIWHDGNEGTQTSKRKEGKKKLLGHVFQHTHVGSIERPDSEVTRQGGLPDQDRRKKIRKKSQGTVVKKGP